MWKVENVLLVPATLSLPRAEVFRAQRSKDTVGHLENAPNLDLGAFPSE